MHDFFPDRTTRDDHGQGWTASLDERLSDVT